MSEHSAESRERFIRIPRPQIFTGPKHQTVDEATVSYLREAAKRVHRERYWGSGVSALVVAVLEDAADAVEATTRVTPPGGGDA